MQFEDDPALLADPFWKAVERVIRMLRGYRGGSVGRFAPDMWDRPEFLNMAGVNKLATDYSVSDRPVFETEHQPSVRWHPNRWRIQVNHPGAGDHVDVWYCYEEHSCPEGPRPQDIQNNVIPQLEAWKRHRAQQLTSPAAGPTQTQPVARVNMDKRPWRINEFYHKQPFLFWLLGLLVAVILAIMAL